MTIGEETPKADVRKEGAWLPAIGSAESARAGKERYDAKRQEDDVQGSSERKQHRKDAYCPTRIEARQ